MVHRPAKEPKQPRNEQADSQTLPKPQTNLFSPSAGLDHILRRKTVQWELQAAAAGRSSHCLRQPPQGAAGRRRNRQSATAGWVRIAEQAAEEATA